MIAPLKTEPRTAGVGRGQGWRRARAAVADALFDQSDPPTKTVQPPAWQAWLLTAWVVFTLAAYVWIMVAAR